MTRRRHQAQAPQPAPLAAAVRVGVHMVAAAAAIAGVLVAALPGSIPGGLALGVGMIAFLLLPLLVAPRRGRFVGGEDGEDGEEKVLTGWSPFELVEMFARALGSAAWIAVIGPALGTRSDSAVVGGIYGFLFGTACVAIAAAGWWRGMRRPDADTPAVTLERTTVTVRNAGGTHVLRYADLREVRVDEATVWLSTATEQLSVVVASGRPRQVAHEIAQRIERAKKADAKAARAARAGESRTPAALKRPHGATAREWLTQLDALAELWRGAEGYRGGGIDEDELWRTLGDENAHLEARTAAARVLTRRSDDQAVRVRVDAAVKELPEPVRVRVASALAPEVEEAAAAFEAAEMAELERGIG